MSSNTLKMMKDNNVKFVDFRFTDTRGKEQHVTVPSSEVNEDLFKDGKPFDGSSISGWKGIEASDMLLMPEDDTAFMDPFTDEPTLILTCDVVEPSTGEGYERDPRSLAKRAEAYLLLPVLPTPATSVQNPNSSFLMMSAGVPT
jgi:glutamine synthetase